MLLQIKQNGKIVLNFWKDFGFFINEVMGKPNREVIDVINDELSPVILKNGGDIDIKCSSWANTENYDALGVKVGKMGGFIAQATLLANLLYLLVPL